MNPQSTPTPEQVPGLPMAEIPQAPERVAAGTPAIGQPAAVPSIPASTPQPVVSVSNEPIAPSGALAGPDIAADIDVIEKEWVDKAEAIIAKTVGDPHAEEEEIEDLTIDYMKKRYDKDVSKSND